MNKIWTCEICGLELPKTSKSFHVKSKCETLLQGYLYDDNTFPWYCSVCRARCNVADHKREHIVSEKHQRKLKTALETIRLRLEIEKAKTTTPIWPCVTKTGSSSSSTTEKSNSDNTNTTQSSFLLFPPSASNENEKTANIQLSSVSDFPALSTNRSILLSSSETPTKTEKSSTIHNNDNRSSINKSTPNSSNTKTSTQQKSLDVPSALWYYCNFLNHNLNSFALSAPHSVQLVESIKKKKNRKRRGKKNQVVVATPPKSFEDINTTTQTQTLSSGLDASPLFLTQTTQVNQVKKEEKESITDDDLFSTLGVGKPSFANNTTQLFSSNYGFPFLINQASSTQKSSITIQPSSSNFDSLFSSDFRELFSNSSNNNNSNNKSRASDKDNQTQTSNSTVPTKIELSNDSNLTLSPRTALPSFFQYSLFTHPIWQSTSNIEKPNATNNTLQDSISLDDFKFRTTQEILNNANNSNITPSSSLLFPPPTSNAEKEITITQPINQTSPRNTTSNSTTLEKTEISNNNNNISNTSTTQSSSIPPPIPQSQPQSIPNIEKLNITTQPSSISSKAPSSSKSILDSVKLNVNSGNNNNNNNKSNVNQTISSTPIIPIQSTSNHPTINFGISNNNINNNINNNNINNINNNINTAQTNKPATGSITPNNHKVVLVDNESNCFSTVTQLRFLIEYCKKNNQVIAVDCEGVNLGKDGRLCLVQMCVPTPNLIVYLFDILSPVVEQIKYILKMVLEDPFLTKVFHDCRSDCAALQHELNIKTVGILDSQVIHGVLEVLWNSVPFKKYSEITKQKPISSLWSGRRVGFNKLLEHYGSQLHPTKEQFRDKFEKEPDFWMKRPISNIDIQYAVNDVILLWDVFNKIISSSNGTFQGVLFGLSAIHSEQKQHTGDFSEKSAPLKTDLLLNFDENNRFQPIYSIIEDEDNDDVRDDDDIDDNFSDENDTFNTHTSTSTTPTTPTHLNYLDEDISTMLSLLPPLLQAEINREFKTNPEAKQLIEIVIDEGRYVFLRFEGGYEKDLKVMVLSNNENNTISITEILEILKQAKSSNSLNSDSSGITTPPLLSGSNSSNNIIIDEYQNHKKYKNLFTQDNRLGVRDTLHRISAMWDRKFERVIGLTFRIGRHKYGSGQGLIDWIVSASNFRFPTPNPSSEKIAVKAPPKSILLLGPPSVGKTTLLREVARLLSTDFRQSVIIVDTSNEIGGDGDIPHQCVGRARRIQIPSRDKQHEILIEAVQNHSPQVIIVDEIGTSKEVRAVKTIVQRGVAMIGTAHGYDLHSLLKNPELNPLLGGLESVTFGDAEAKRTGSKTGTRRAGEPAFNILIEILERKKWRIHSNIKESVDTLLAGGFTKIETRWQDEKSGRYFASFDSIENLVNPSDINWLADLLNIKTTD